MSTTLTSYDKYIQKAVAKRYEIYSLAGKGGMASVYRAVQKGLDRDVALKVIHPAYLSDEELLGRFRLEAKSAARLNHPHIITIYDQLEIEDLVMMALEFLDGEDLAQKIRVKGAMGASELLPHMVAMADALDYVHRKNIIHRDIKSSNIFITREDRAVLTDFGIASLKQNTVKLTTPGTVMGTPEFMSPEQARAQSVDHRSDIYSLGVVMYQCLTGKVPFHADTPVATLHQIDTQEPPDFADDPKMKPAWLKSIVFKCLSKSPEDRFQSARDLKAALLEEKPVRKVTFSQDAAAEDTSRKEEAASKEAILEEQLQKFKEEYQLLSGLSAQIHFLAQAPQEIKNTKAVKVELERLQSIQIAREPLSLQQQPAQELLDKFEKAPRNHYNEVLQTLQKLKPAERAFSVAPRAAELYPAALHLQHIEKALPFIKKEINRIKNLADLKKLLAELDALQTSLKVCNAAMEKTLISLPDFSEELSELCLSILAKGKEMGEGAQKPEVQIAQAAALWELFEGNRFVPHYAKKAYLDQKELWAKEGGSVLMPKIEPNEKPGEDQPNEASMETTFLRQEKREMPDQKPDVGSTSSEQKQIAFMVKEIEKEQNQLRKRLSSVIGSDSMISRYKTLVSQEGMLRSLYKAFSPKVKNNLFHLYFAAAKTNGHDGARALRAHWEQQYDGEDLTSDLKSKVWSASSHNSALDLRENSYQNQWDNRLKNLLKELPGLQGNNNPRDFSGYSQKVFPVLYPYLEGTTEALWQEEL